MLCAVGNDRILRTLSGFVALKKEIEKAVLLAACTPGRLPQRAAQPTVTLARASAQPLAVARAQHRTTGRLLTAGKHTHVGTQLSRQCPGRDDIHAGKWLTNLSPCWQPASGPGADLRLDKPKILQQPVCQQLKDCGGVLR